MTPPETTDPEIMGGAAVSAPADLAAPAEHDDRVFADVMAKVDALSGRLSELSAIGALGQQAQTREAVTRAELTAALSEALAGRVAAEAELREQARLRLGERATSDVPAAWTYAPQRLDRWLGRLGSLGQALVISRSGLWRGSGRGLHDLRHMAAYARRGANPEIVPPAPFDQAWYLQQPPAVGLAPLVHYLLAGAGEGRSPHPLFDGVWYVRTYGAHMSDPQLTPLQHYLSVGVAAGFDPHPLFDVSHYRAQAPELAEDEDPISHYLRVGGPAGLSPHLLFDAPGYRGWSSPAPPEAPLFDYLVSGWRRGVAPHVLFDAAWYLQTNPDVRDAGLEPLTHYVTHGGLEGRSPHPLFDGAHYLAQGAELAPGEDPLSHYLRTGWSTGLSPHPLFDVEWYVAKAPAAAAGPAMLHYLTVGWRSGLSPHPLFDTPWYLSENPDVVRAEIEPLTHYVTTGAAEGRDPGPWFDTAAYVAARAGALAGATPLADYLQGGAWALAEAQPGLATAAWIAANPGAVRSGLTPLEDWARRAS
jgi:hypothetical protein